MPATDPSDHAAVDLPDHAVVDLLGLVALGELLAFERMAADARLAPDLRRRAALGGMAAAEIGNYRRVADRLAALGVLPDDAMAPYVGPLQAYHDSTEPRDWAEAVTKAYVGDAITDDFLREIAVALAEPDRQLVLDVLHDSSYAAFAVAEIRAAVEADPRVAGRLSMWARRLVGEALSQAGRVAAAERGALTGLVARSGRVDVEGLFQRLTVAHSARMAAAGLNN
ncbi:ferritin-like fold-containing protein [Micromonospora sp. NPDC049051]|uniref:ferritin-like fold-containing protein n=1 Tax=Micromonospora sp. NPDC049051 TaxID=3364264 RepID=UPI003710B374